MLVQYVECTEQVEIRFKSIHLNPKTPINEQKYLKKEV